MGISNTGLSESSESSLSIIAGNVAIDRRNADHCRDKLSEIHHEIRSVWVVRRPTNYDPNSLFFHFALKIQAPPALISLDFGQKTIKDRKGKSTRKGFFGCEIVPGTTAELDDFFYYFYNDNRGQLKTKKWEIVSSLTPFIKDKKLKNYCSDKDQQILEIIQNNYTLFKKYRKNKQKLRNSFKSMSAYQLDRCVDFVNMKSIDLDTKIELNVHLYIYKYIRYIILYCKYINFINRDLADFIDTWIEENDTYDPIKHNCQKFVYKAYALLLGQKYQYKLLELNDLMQSPHDKRLVKENDKYAKINHLICGYLKLNKIMDTKLQTKFMRLIKKYYISD